MHMSVDTREAPQQILHARLQTPVSPGDQALVYPKWIPGEHGPTGPMANMTGLTIRARGQLLPWRRDALDGQHLQLLEETGLVHTEKLGRVRTCRLEPTGFLALHNWVQYHRSTWERGLDRLGELLAESDDMSTRGRP
jgi:hypothetical protein